LPVLSYPSQVLLDRVGLLAVNGGGFASGDDPDLESYLDSGGPLVFIHIIAYNARAFIIRRPFSWLFPQARSTFVAFSAHSKDSSSSRLPVVITGIHDACSGPFPA
jgi:hypothetical protein